MLEHFMSWVFITRLTQVNKICRGNNLALIEKELVDLIGLLRLKIHIKLKQMFSFAFSFGALGIVIYV